METKRVEDGQQLRHMLAQQQTLFTVTTGTMAAPTAGRVTWTVPGSKSAVAYLAAVTGGAAVQPQVDDNRPRSQ